MSCASGEWKNDSAGKRSCASGSSIWIMSRKVGRAVGRCCQQRRIRSYSLSGQFSGRSITPPSITYRSTWSLVRPYEEIWD